MINLAGRIDNKLEETEAQDIIKVINNYSNALNLLDSYDYKDIKKDKNKWQSHLFLSPNPLGLVIFVL